ncbi:hypothetical protein AB835_01565 [Candidatus Endobugula sertula]|uniref:Uncharacterized protein n=1 Tax=Candidatus Endobugula sertula TaxID=62101 RepID=A0A1D2QTB4_9GAMM|nr:hypothetical protein AB835_01565 [Candidatus Endobugula sertula]
MHKRELTSLFAAWFSPDGEARLLVLVALLLAGNGAGGERSLQALRVVKRRYVWLADLARCLDQPLKHLLKALIR